VGTNGAELASEEFALSSIVMNEINIYISLSLVSFAMDERITC
jgi:hypothetical protein